MSGVSLKTNPAEGGRGYNRQDPACRRLSISHEESWKQTPGAIMLVSLLASIFGFWVTHTRTRVTTESPKVVLSGRKAASSPHPPPLVSVCLYMCTRVCMCVWGGDLCVFMYMWKPEINFRYLSQEHCSESPTGLVFTNQFRLVDQ